MPEPFRIMNLESRSISAGDPTGERGGVFAGMNISALPRSKGAWREGDFRFYFDGDSPVGGKAAEIAISPIGGENQYFYQKIRGDFGGKRFRYSAWVRTQDATGSFLLTIKFYYEDWATSDPKKEWDVYFLCDKKGTNPWQRYEKEFTAPPNCQELIVCLIGKTGTGYADGYELEVLDEIR